MQDKHINKYFLITLFMPMYVFAVEDTLRNISDWITGPIASVAIVIALALGLYSIMFDRDADMDKLKKRLFAAIVLLLLPVLVRTLENIVR